MASHLIQALPFALLLSLLPYSCAGCPPTAFAALSGDAKEFSSLLRAVQQAGLTELLNSSDSSYKFTFFAPVDSAWVNAGLNPDRVPDNVDLRATILNHIVPDVQLKPEQLGSPPVYSPSSARVSQAAAYRNDKIRAGTSAAVIEALVDSSLNCTFVVYKVDTVLKALTQLPGMGR